MRDWSYRRNVPWLCILWTAPLFAWVTSGACAADLPRHAILGASVVDKDGVRITSIRTGAPAERGGLRVGDTILSIGDEPVQTTADFVSRIKGEPTGRPITFKVRRDDTMLSLAIILAAAPDEEDAQVDTLYQSVSIDGTLRRTLLTVPKGVTGRLPAVLILGGIGCFTIDNASDPQDSYMRLAHDLSRKGFVVMRLEKSGVGDSQGPPCLTVDLLTEMRSYEVALHRLQSDPRVNVDAVYLFGHSIGSLMAPRIANQGRVTGIIIADGVGRNWIEYELWNLRRQLELAGEPPMQVDAALAAKELCMHRLLIEKQEESEIERTHPECRAHNSYPAPASYLQQAASLNIAESWTRFSLPLLAIYGTADFVTTEADHRRIVSIVNAFHPGAATLKLVPGMDHHFDVGGTEQQAYDLRVKQKGAGPYAEGLSSVVSEWLCAREKCTGAPNSLSSFTTN